MNLLDFDSEQSNTNSGITIDFEIKDELCLSDLYALLQASISSLDTAPTDSIDTLTLLMERICSMQGSLQPNPPMVRLEFWRQVNATWLFVIESLLKTRHFNREEWKDVCKTVVAAGDVLCLYGLVDYPMGFQEYKIVEAICNGIENMD
jgi:hypothetical protein